MVRDRSLGYRIFDWVLYAILMTMALSCLLPFVHLLSKSFSNRQSVSADIVGLWPIGFNIENYAYIMGDRQFLSSFGVSTARVLLGVVLTLFITVITAYPLSRDRIHMPGRTAIKVLLLIGMLFSAGLIPSFLAIRNLGLYNNFLVLVIPGALSIFNVIVVMNFFRGIPAELEEAALLDGASHMDILFRVFIPVSLPVLATVTLFTAVGHWNAWFDGIVFLSKSESWPLQSFMYTVITSRMLEWQTSGIGMGAKDASQSAQSFMNATPQGLVAAMIFIASLPIMLVYPFLQRYFVTGLTIGSVKG
ncbi:MAG: carbohydrate ABC transporter permease [Chloroflexi bacterium]|nr:carbohydrate ABC transporter permease [Chloroflexota bacterium]